MARRRFRLTFVSFLSLVVGGLLLADLLLVVPAVRLRLGLEPRAAPPERVAGRRAAPAAPAPAPAPAAAVVQVTPTPVPVPRVVEVAPTPVPSPAPAVVAAAAPTPRPTALPAAGRTAGTLDGTWNLSATVDESSYVPYRNLTTGYELVFRQQGDRLTARGAKVSEGGRALPRRARSAMTLEGTLRGDTLEARYVLHGSRRPSRGSFTWHVSADRTQLEGPFTSDVAGSRGHSIAFRSP